MGVFLSRWSSSESLAAHCDSTLGVFLFFRQKTAYDMRISGWSSDAGSSDLPLAPGIALPAREILRRRRIVGGEKRVEAARPDVDEHGLHGADQFAHVRDPARLDRKSTRLNSSH